MISIVLCTYRIDGRLLIMLLKKLCLDDDHTIANFNAKLSQVDEIGHLYKLRPCVTSVFPFTVTDTITKIDNFNNETI